MSYWPRSWAGSQTAHPRFPHGVLVLLEEGMLQTWDCSLLGKRAAPDRTRGKKETEPEKPGN